MYINLPFIRLGYKYEKPVNVVLNLGTLEDLCTEAGIEFYQINDYIIEHGIDFSRLLLYHGYMNGCKYTRSKPKYTMKHAELWAGNIKASEQSKIFSLIKDMFATIKSVGEAGTKKKVS